MRRRLRTAAIIAAAVLALIAALLALPVDEWRTGRQAASPLALVPGDRLVPPAARLWIDSDAACGHGRRTDPDDCFAVLLLAEDSAPVAGIASVFGNAPIDVTDATLRELVQRRFPPDGRPPVHRGAAVARTPWVTPADSALAAALEQGPLDIVALGPLTNLASVLKNRPDLRPKVKSLVAVMGRRPGHIFHPAEGVSDAALLGHGPVFRDFNFEQDPKAVEEVLAMALPLVLVPYDAARHFEVTGDHLERMRRRGGAWAWTAERASGWLDYWKSEIDRPGFYPFDAMAAAFVLRPDLLRCAPVSARVARDDTLFWPVRGQLALLVDQRRDGQGKPAVYCPALADGMAAWLDSQWAPGAGAASPASSRRRRRISRAPRRGSAAPCSPSGCPSP
jgi:purine nucleosidase